MKKALMVGAGGWARQCWIDEVLPAFKDRIAVIGLVDSDASALHDSGKILGLPSKRCYTDLGKAFLELDADFCIISIPTVFHKEAVLTAVKHGMHILSEKPIADNIDDIWSIYNAVMESSIKMAITQNYRYETPILTMKKILRNRDLGHIDYIVARYASDYRKPNSWRVGNAHERDNPLLIEGAVHQFDMIRNLADANCETIYGFGWNPSWSSFRGNPNGMYLMQMENGTKAVYEGNSLAAGQINNWYHEYYRVECEGGAVTVNRDQIVRIYRRSESGDQTVEKVPLIEVPLTGHCAILSDFLRWLDGGEPVETQLEDNIYSAAMIAAALAAGIDGEIKKVSDFIPVGIMA